MKPVIRRRAKLLAIVVAALAIGAALFVLGRVTAPTSHKPRVSIGSYIDGLRDGAAQGREQGRAFQLGTQLPANDRHVARDAFRAGYAAGANDVFAGYDGGWAYGVPWVITLAPGRAGIDHQILGRTQVEPGIAYFLCPNGRSLCHQPR